MTETPQDLSAWKATTLPVPVRLDGRTDSQLRAIKITPDVSLYAEGSAMVEFGHTKVLCTAYHIVAIDASNLSANVGSLSGRSGRHPTYKRNLSALSRKSITLELICLI